MKHLILFFTLLTSSLIYSQNCNSTFFPLVKGALMEQTMYDASNKIQSKTTSTINDVIVSSAGYKANVTVKHEDSKGKETYSGKFNVECTGGVLLMDMKSFFGPEQMAAFKDMNIEFKGGFMETPTNIKVGDTLRRGTMTMTVSSDAIGSMNTDLTIYDRKVLAKESVTVPAGTFMCYKISSKTNITMTMAGMPAPMSKVVENTEWISEGVGNVKSEMYDAGKVSHTMLLTKFSK